MRGPPPEGVDLDVTFINRAPLYQAYCVDYTYDVPNQPGRPFLCPGTENDKRWPEQGEVVTFTAHIINKGTLSSSAFDYAWHIDGAEIVSGTLPALAPAAEITATYQWPWAHGLSPDGQRALGEHTVRFTVDPADAVPETYETNNSLEDRTNAMSFSMYITPEMYEAYNLPVDPSYPYSTEDWLQKQIAAMNANFANAIYPATPQGAALRVRINTIGVTPTNPEPDSEHDGGWFFHEDVRHGASAYYDPATDIDWGLVHEVGVHDTHIVTSGVQDLPAGGGGGVSATAGEEVSGEPLDERGSRHPGSLGPRQRAGVPQLCIECFCETCERPAGWPVRHAAGALWRRRVVRFAALAVRRFDFCGNRCYNSCTRPTRAPRGWKEPEAEPGAARASWRSTFNSSQPAHRQGLS